MQQVAETIAQQLERFAAVIGGNAWGADKGKPRIYMDSRRDTKVFFDFQDYEESLTNHLAGSKLNVYIDSCGQHKNWYASQKQRVIYNHRCESLALMCLCQGTAKFDALADEIMDLECPPTDRETDQAASEIVNGNADAARAALMI